jgi:hypothetical protein
VAAVLACSGIFGSLQAQVPARSFVPARWAITNPVPGRLDSPLLMPGPMAASETTVYIYDYGDARLKAFDLMSGELRWALGRRGEGPGEFANPTDVRLDDRGQIWILDPPNQRINRVGEDGRFVSSLRVNEALFRLGPIVDGQITVVRDDPASGFACRLDQDGNRVSDIAVPPWTATVPALAASVWVAVDPKTSGWVAVFPYTGRILLSSGAIDLKEVVGVVATGEDPKVITSSPRSGWTVRRLDPEAKMVALSVALSPTEVWVLGRSKDGGRVVDRYDRTSASYLGSWRLPLPLDKITAAGRRMVGIQRDSLPALFVLDPGSAHER